MKTNFAFWHKNVETAVPASPPTPSTMFDDAVVAVADTKIVEINKQIAVVILQTKDSENI